MVRNSGVSDLTGWTITPTGTNATDSTLTTSSATFTWSTGNGVSAFWLFAGSSQGAKNYHDSLLLANTVDTRTVTGLPTDGSAIYVRLWYMVSGIWYSKDYTYTAFTVPGSSLPDMSSPSNGATLTGATQTFTWNAGTSATAYYLQVGDKLGAYNYSDSGQLAGSVLSQTVAGLPTNGSPVYLGKAADGSTVFVRLWTKQGTAWLYNDYSFRANSP